MSVPATVERALRDAGYVPRWSLCDSLVVTVGGDQPGDPRGDTALVEVRALVLAYGCIAEWAWYGEYPTSDIWVEVQT